ncbi:3692_t:CDS:2, partial [Gigaspora margarita]
GCKRFLRSIQNKSAAHIATRIEKEPSDEKQHFLPKYLNTIHKEKIDKWENIEYPKRFEYLYDFEYKSGDHKGDLIFANNYGILAAVETKRMTWESLPFWSVCYRVIDKKRNKYIPLDIDHSDQRSVAQTGNYPYLNVELFETYILLSSIFAIFAILVDEETLIRTLSDEENQRILMRLMIILMDEKN